ncbi:MFS transporter [Parasphingorhabdus flavimaris]|uniref:MFS transporter n=1 Tax=Parasphingorhabdus flavimaris TaxID=266812 RepID=A0ABX2N311_9SPHN|nr:MFS transporter [Parasphingorhabdus flavimaris]NVD27956.1 MFS transporter [Parasphingorhabdus flavimaris]|tara:strand:- start:43608 stop:44894 length:1287 start_codon:yes stop_codon:yes gene_type:complete
MQNTAHLLRTRRFLPLFLTQLLGAFNDNLFKFSMVILVTYGIYESESEDFAFNALASGLFILPFFLFSSLAGQLADNYDKARITRFVKTLEIFIAVIGGIGLWLHSIPVMLTALFLLGLQSTFFGPIKYAVLPQHLQKDEVLGGTGLVEAGTYIAILAGTILGGIIIDKDGNGVEIAVVTVFLVALIGRIAAQFMPEAPAQKEVEKIDFNFVRSSFHLISATLHVRKLYLAIIAISFFWTIGSVLIIQFPPLVENVLTATPQVASLFLGVFSIGIAIGSVLVNRLLKSEVSARFAPVSVILMGGSVLLLYFIARGWDGLPNGDLYTFETFIVHEGAWSLLATLGGVSIFGGMFVVPLYAFLTTTVDISQTARTIAANNVVNSGCMVLGALAAMGLSMLGVSTTEQLLLVAAMCLVAAWLGHQLHRACD